MNPASRRTLLAVGGCAVGVAAALGWATVHALRLERRELDAQAQAKFQNSIRLALWRMDSALTPIVVRETARPYFQYSAFYPSERAYTSKLQDVEPGEHLVPSPLLTLDQQFVKLYFQRSAAGELTSPQAPSGNFRDLVESSVIGSERVIAAEARLSELGRILAGGSRSPLAAAELKERLKDVPLTEMNQVQLGESGVSELAYKAPQKPVEGATQQLAQSNEESRREFEARQQTAGRAVQLEKQANVVDKQVSVGQRRASAKDESAAEDKKNDAPGVAPDASRKTAVAPAPEAASAPAPVVAGLPASSRGAGGAAPASDAKALGTFNRRDDSGAAKEAAKVAADDGRTDPGAGRVPDSATEGDGSGIEQGDMAPAWRVVNGVGEPQLLLLRSVRVGESRFEQGCWLDWPALKAWLVSSVQDLLPGATLQPVMDPYAQADPEALGRRLAGISAELEPGAVPVLAAPGWTPMRTTLVLTWGAVVLSFGAIGAALLAARELAERRGQFVSAVTHELRTPLTTFCLYSQMLADGMVTEESARRDYLGTLKRESERLTKIVENVLDYARVGRARGGPKREAVGVGDLVERITPSLEARAAQSGVTLEAPRGIDPGLSAILVEVDAVSVERILVNLVDNACKYAPGQPVRLGVRAAGRNVELSIADSGPGIPGEQRGRLFQPFERGRSLAHATTPGLGLGLALSRALARRMGGELELSESSALGSVFVLRVPRA